MNHPLVQQLLWIRENSIRFYKRFETVILFAVKLIAAMYVFHIINGIGLWREELAPLYTPPLDFPFFMLSALLFAVLPPTAGHVLLLLTILAQISLSLEVAVFVFLLLLLVIAFYGRIAPKKSYLIIAMVIAFRMNLPYGVAIFAGLYLGMTSIIPIAIGTCLSYFIPFFATLAETVRTPTELDLIALPMTFFDLYKTIFEGLTANLDWIIWAFVLAMTTLAVYAISRLTIRYAKDIAIGAGTAVLLIGLGVAGGIAGIDIPMGSVFGGTILSLLLVYTIRFFDSILDYKKVERVQFEDEENFYYVKVVPKITGRHPGEAREAAASPRTASVTRTPRTSAAREGATAASAARPPRETHTSVLPERRPLPDIRRAGAETRMSSDTIVHQRVTPERSASSLPPVRRPAPKPDPEIADMVFDDEDTTTSDTDK